LFEHTYTEYKNLVDLTTNSPLAPFADASLTIKYLSNYTNLPNMYVTTRHDVVCTFER